RSRSSWPAPPSRSSSPATSTGEPVRAPPGQTTTTWSPLGYSAQRPRAVRAEQVGVPSGISPVWDDPEVAIRTLVIAVGWSLLERSRGGGEWITTASPPRTQLVGLPDVRGPVSWSRRRTGWVLGPG